MEDITYFCSNYLNQAAVSLRILLWKSYNNKFLNLLPPTFGLNFLEGMKSANKDFMLLCGFEKFDDIYVRIDILERLFLLIFNSDKNDNREIKVVPEMLNLLGCSKDNFKRLLIKMDYKVYEKEKEYFIKYLPIKERFLKRMTKKTILTTHSVY